MSRAFTKEPEPGAPGEPPPERPISEHPNHVTPTGLQELKDEQEALGRRRAELLELLEHAEENDLPADEEQVARDELAYVDRDLRYVHARLESAIPVDLSTQPRHEVAFGATVSVAASGKGLGGSDRSDEDSVSLDARPHQTWTIVGEDEADPDDGKVSYVSPLAKALLGAKLGQRVTWHRPAGPLRLTVERISYRG